MVNSKAFIIWFYHVWKQAKRKNSIYKLYNLFRNVNIHIHIHIYSSCQSITNLLQSYHLFHSKTEFMGRRSKERFMLTGIGQKVPKTNPERIKWCRGLYIIQKKMRPKFFRIYLQILSILPKICMKTANC